jgi:hypothetical protein
MASTYVNDLRLNEMATGDASGSWGTVTNTNLELIGEAFSYGTETIGDADSTLTIADGAADAARSFYLKITSSVDLTTTRIVTLGPNTVSKVWMIENATTGSQVITIKQGSGATINVPNGQVKMISTDGAGSGGAVLDLLVDVDLTGTTTLVNLDVSGTALVTGVLTTTAATVSNGGGQFNGAINVGVDDTGYDVKFFGATAGAYMLWDESADDLILGGAAGLSVNSTALVTGVLTTTAATVFNGGFASNANSTVGGTLAVTGVVTANAGVVVDNFTLDGTTLALSSGEFVLDVASAINFNSDTGNFRFQDAAVDVGIIQIASSDFIIRSLVSDKDIIFQGNDGGSTITALTLDMSAAGNATFNSNVLLPDNRAFVMGASSDFQIYHESSVNIIQAATSDQDIVFKGNDGGSTITALTLDMSEAGAATFNSTITAAGGAGVYDNTANVLTLNGTQHTRLLIDTASTGGHVAGLTLESNGQLTNFTNSGSGSTIANDIGVFTIDSADDIVLDAGGSDILLRASGTIFGSLRENSSNFRIKSDVLDKDMLFLGNDGGVEFTALTLDMSDGGNAIFSGQITSSRGAATSTYGFRHNGAGKYMRMGCPNESYAYFETDSDSGFNFDGNVFVNGALSKNSGSFKIDHPLPAKTETHNLVHSFIEGPQADNIYRGKVALVDGSATVNIDDVAGMTDGTFAVLNREVQCFTSNETGWTAVRGSVSGNILTIEAQDASCTDTISWMVIGERQDKHMYDTEWTDENGKVIVEPLKEK